MEISSVIDLTSSKIFSCARRFDNWKMEMSTKFVGEVIYISERGGSKNLKIMELDKH